MNIGEILVKFGAETSGLMGGLKLVVGALGLFGGASKAAGSGLALISSQIATTEARLAFLKNSAVAGGVGFNGLAGQITATEAKLASLQGSAAAMNATMVESSAVVDGLKIAFVALIAIAAIAAVALVFVAVSSAKMAGDFQASLTRLFTTAGELHQNLQMVGESILAMSVQVGYGAQQLVQAMYWVESGGFHGAAGLNVLRLAAEGAKAENSDLDTVAHALVATLNAYRGTGLTAAEAMNTLIGATANGMMTLQQLSGVISSVLPVAAKFHISLIDIGAGLATMTAMGDPAAQAATHLRQVILAIESPAAAGAKAIKEIGLTTQQVSNEMRVSLPGAIEMITTALGKKFPEGTVAYNNAMKAIAGGNKQLLALLDLSGTSLQIFKNNVLNIASAVRIGGKDVMGWADVQGNFNTKMDQAKAGVEALRIIIGERFLPVLSKIMDFITPIIVSFTTWVIKSHVVEDSINKVVATITTLVAIGKSIISFFKNSELAMDGLKGALIAVAGIILYFLVPALWAAVAAGAVAVGEFLILVAPFVLIGAAIAIVVAAFIHFYNTSAGFRSVIDAIVGALKAAGAAVLQFAGYLMAQVGPGITIARQFFIQLWATLQQGWAVIQQAAAALARIGVAIYSTVLPYVTMLAGILRGQFLPVWAQLMATWAAIQPLLAQLAGVFRMLWATIQQLAAVFMAQLMPTLRSTAAALSALWSVIGPSLLPGLKMLAMVIGGVLLVSLGLLVGMLTGVTGALARFLSGAIQVVQGVIQVFTGLAEFFTGIVSFVVDLFTGKWGKLAGDLAMIWQGIVNMLQGACTAMIGIFNATFGIIIGFVSGFIDGVIGFFTTLWHQLVGGSIVPDMCAGIIAAFSNMIATVLGLVSGFIANLIGRFVSLRSQALAQLSSLVSGAASVLSQLVGIAARAGQAMIAALVGQINAGVGWVSSAINNVVAAIGNVLPHSPAKEGPLRDLNKFGPAITHGLAAGILSGSPEVRAAVNMMVQPIKGAMTGSIGATGGVGQGTSTASDNRPIIIQIGQAEYRGFVQNLGRDLATTVVIQRGGMR